MSFRIYNPCIGNGGHCGPRILAAGVIDPGAPTRLRGFLAAHREALPTHVTVTLDSVGGEVKAAMDLGRIFRLRRFDTVVRRTETQTAPDPSSGIPAEVPLFTSGVCASACVLAFAGGVQREVVDDLIIGVHQFAGRSGDLGEAAAQRLLSAISMYLSEMGIDRRLSDLASRMAPSSLQRLSIADAVAFNLDNSNSRQQPWSVDAGQGGELAAVTRMFNTKFRSATHLALFKRNGQLNLAIAVEFFPESFGTARDAVERLQGSTVELSTSFGKTHSLEKTSWRQLENMARTDLPVNAGLLEALKRSKRIGVEVWVGTSGRSLTPTGDFEVQTLQPLLAAVLRH